MVWDSERSGQVPAANAAEALAQTAAEVEA
jgi:hypothetical protein